MASQLKLARRNVPAAQWDKITPAIAAAMLEHNKHNRSLSQMLVDRYAAEMKRGAWDQDNGETIKITTDGTVVEEAARRAMAHGCPNLAGSGILVSSHFLFSTMSKAAGHEELADKFFEQLGTGIFDNATATKTHPIRTLREKMLANRNSASKMVNGLQLALFIKAWNAYASGRALQVLRAVSGESFPAVV